MKKIKLLYNYFKDRLGKRLIFQNSPEGPSGAPEAEKPEAAEKPEEAEAAPEKIELTDADRRNMTRTHAAKISERLKAMGNEAANKIAEEIDSIYQETVEAENSHDPNRINTATQKLRAALLGGRAHLESQEVTDRTNAEIYAERELKLGEELPEVKKAREKALTLNAKVNKKAEELKKKDIDVSNISSILTAGTKLFYEGKFEEAANKFSEYEKKLASLSEAREKKKDPKSLAVAAKKSAEDKAAEFIQKGVDASDLRAAGRANLETGDVYLARSEFKKAEESYKAALQDYESFASRTEGAAAETEEEIESVDTKQVMNRLQDLFAYAVRTNGAGKFDRFRNFVVNPMIVSDMKAAFNSFKPAERKAVLGSSVNYVTTNPNNRKEAWIITATFARSGDILLKQTAKLRESDKEITDEERKEIGKFEKTGELYELMEAAKAREKSPEEVNKIILKAVREKVAKWAEKGVADDTVLKREINKAVSEVKNDLTEDEWKSVDLHTGLTKVPGTTWDWEYQVDIADGNVTVETD